MAEEKNSNTEEHILEIAKTVFEEKGLAGARMQEIADRAGINKSLLHYYYRSKEKLFQTVFRILITKVLREFAELFDTDESLETKIRYFFEKHISILQKNPNLPVFMINEINQNPERIIKIATDAKIHLVYSKFFKQIEDGIANGTIRQVTPLQVLATVLSMSVFPVAAKEMLRGIFSMSKDEYNTFLDQRKKEAADFVINAIIIRKEN